MGRHDVVVLAASAGGVEALSTLVSHLPADLPAAVFVVQHVGGTSVLPRILSNAGPLPAVHAVDQAPIRQGTIVVAPPGRHLVLGPGYVRVISGPKENNVRPAADVLFRSAARVFGARVLGAVLSGSLSDGTAGLDAIAHAGGLTVVQDPREALVPDMPRNALENVKVDHVLSLKKIAALIARQAREGSREDSMVETETDPSVADPRQAGVPSSFSCPDCGGVLWELDDGDILRFRCRVGHGYTGDSLEQQQVEHLEMALFTALRAFEENAHLSRRMARRSRERGHDQTAERFEERAAEADVHAARLREALGKPLAPARETGEIVTVQEGNGGETR